MEIQYVYLVRHGETQANREERVQGFNEELSALGHTQAKNVAGRCAGLTFTSLIASDMVRAQQTAQAISLTTGKVIISEPLFREVTRPKVFEGISRASEEYQAFLANEMEHVDDPNWQFEDGEHFSHLSKRALDALSYIESYNADSLIVVSHGLFIKYIAATVLLQKQLSSDVWHNLGKTLRMDNTGITVLRRVVPTNEWSLLTWNDKAHFAE